MESACRIGGIRFGDSLSATCLLIYFGVEIIFTIKTYEEPVCLGCNNKYTAVVHSLRAVRRLLQYVGGLGENDT